MNAPTQSSLMEKFHEGEPLSASTIILVDDLYFDLMDPSTWVFNVKTIARSLSNLCRFNGHIENFYSVAEHAVRVSEQLQQWGYSDRVQFLGLHHDDIESIIGDIPSPHKRHMSFGGEPIHDLEKTLEYAYFATFGNMFLKTFDRDWEAVKRADLAVYLAERAERPVLGRGLLPTHAYMLYLSRHSQHCMVLGLPTEYPY